MNDDAKDFRMDVEIKKVNPEEQSVRSYIV